MQMPEQFWMVSGPGPCSSRHASREAAETEAKRLARLRPEHWFYVVEAVSAHIKDDVKSVSLRDRVSGHPDDLPF